MTTSGLVSAGTLAVATPGSFTQSGGTLAVGTLGGTADSIDLGRTGAARIDRIANLRATGTSPGTLTVVDQAPLQLSGTVAARYLNITATGRTDDRGRHVPPDQRPAPVRGRPARRPPLPGSTLAVRPGVDGSATIQQLGTATISPVSGPVATVRFDLHVRRRDTDAEQSAGRRPPTSPSTSASGSATGNLFANNLTVLGANGQATFTGEVQGRTDATAAQFADLLPGLDLRYTLNGCAISITSCFVGTADIGTVFLPAAAISSVLRPDILSQDVIDLSPIRDRDDPTLLLPNISDRDY